MNNITRRDIRKAMLAKIHIAKSQFLGGDDDAYRGLIQGCSGGEADSAANLSLHQLESVLIRLEKMGFEYRRPKEKADESQRLALLAEVRKRAPEHLGENWEIRLSGLVKRMARVEKLEWVRTPEQLRTILKVMTEVGAR